MAAFPKDATVEHSLRSAARQSESPRRRRGRSRPRSAAAAAPAAPREGPPSSPGSAGDRERAASASGTPGPKSRTSIPSRSPARAGQDDRPHLGIRPDGGARLRELGHHHVVDGVEAVGPAQPDHCDAGRGGFHRHGVRHSQTRSTIVAVPMPPPVHIVTRPVVRSRRSNSSRMVAISMAPVAPIG